MLINIQTTDKELKDFFNGFKKDFSLLNQKLDSIMANQADFKAVIDRIDVATNNIAAEVKDLKEKVKVAGLDETAESDILAQFDSVATKLEGIGKEELPPAPTPDPEPTPDPVPAPDENAGE